MQMNTTATPHSVEIGVWECVKVLNMVESVTPIRQNMDVSTLGEPKREHPLED